MGLVDTFCCYCAYKKEQVENPFLGRGGGERRETSAARDSGGEGFKKQQGRRAWAASLVERQILGIGSGHEVEP